MFVQFRGTKYRETVGKQYSFRVAIDYNFIINMNIKMNIISFVVTIEGITGIGI